MTFCVIVSELPASSKESSIPKTSRFDKDDMKLIDKSTTDEAELAGIDVEKTETADSDNENEKN